jgi:hypothetical protein
VTSIAALMASTCVRKPKHRRQARSAPSVLELSIFHGLSLTDIYSHCSEPVELLAWNISGVLVATAEAVLVLVVYHGTRRVTGHCCWRHTSTPR